MKRISAQFEITDFQKTKIQMLNWANRFNICCFLDNHQYNSPYHSVECLLAVDAHSTITNTSPTELKQLLQTQNDWLFGHVSFDYKNRLFPLQTKQKNKIGFEELFFFQPKTVIKLSASQIVIETIHSNPKEIFTMICSEQIELSARKDSIQLQSKTNREKYVQIINQLKQHILRGDCYEINFCTEFFAEANLNPVETYFQLTNLSPVPFAAFYKNQNSYLLCASPERFVQRKNTQIISQPIKGTVKRNLEDATADEQLKKELFSSPKERSENVMVVDLVRNDLSKICKEGSVRAPELFGVYSFPQVHQLISTISGELKEGINFADVLEAAFPMGSMTGAPKFKVLQLIDQYETAHRGLFSGCVGYIAPNGDFDFNVVIRSILYNSVTNYISCLAGGGITFNSNAEKEYEECLLKAKAMMKALGSYEL